MNRIPHRIRAKRRHLGRLVVQHPCRLGLQPRLHRDTGNALDAEEDAHKHSLSGRRDLRERGSECPRGTDLGDIERVDDDSRDEGGTGGGERALEHPELLVRPRGRSGTRGGGGRRGRPLVRRCYAAREVDPRGGGGHPGGEGAPGAAHHSARLARKP